jgi:hypothetical protein
MRFLPLLGRHLKDDQVIELLELYNMDVVYDFDRLHENTPDKYWAASKAHGFPFRFTGEQRPETIFLYVASVDGFSAINRSEIDVPLFDGVSEVEAHCTVNGFRFARGHLGPGALAERDWGRVDTDEWSAHYDFRQGGLTLISLSLPRKR